MPYLRQWKSKQLLHLSKVYKDESVSNESNLLKDGVRKARIANLLDPENKDTEENFLELLYRSSPAEALQKWSKNLDKQSDEESRSLLLNRSLITLKKSTLPPRKRRIAGEIAISQLNTLLKSKEWLETPDNSLLAAELIAETGNPLRSKEIILSSLSNHPTHTKSIFFLTRLIVHLNDTENLGFIGKKLAKLATRKTPSGVEAIRHMTLLHVLNPLSQQSLKRCIDLLKENSHAESIDFMRIFALQFISNSNPEIKGNIINTCAEQFNLKEEKELLIFAKWLVRLGAFNELIEYLPPTKAKLNEDLFKIRMNALAQLKDLENIHFEVKNAPIIPERWRLVIESRAYALEGNYKESIKVLDRLLPILGNDPRLVRSICDYLESAQDIKGLTHILQKLVDQPIHQGYALKKLMHHRAASATLEELLGWMNKLSKLHNNDPHFSEIYLYFELLDPFLASPSQKLNSLIDEAKQNMVIKDTSQSRITLALAHLRNHAPDQALVALGSIQDWRLWQDTRPAWAFICSLIYQKNHDSEKATILQKSIDFSKFDRAEKESLVQLFPQSFPLSQ